MTHYFSGEVPGDVSIRHTINVVSLKERDAVAIVGTGEVFAIRSDNHLLDYIFAPLIIYHQLLRQVLL